MKTCKVLVVDDEIKAAVGIGKHLQTLNGSPALAERGIELEIELATSACWAWREIEKQPDRWHVVVSDVMMPLETDKQTRYKAIALEGFTIHLQNGAKGAACFTGGGFERLAKPLAEARERDTSQRWPKLVLTSNKLDGDERKRVNAFERDHASWFRYLDKAESWGGNQALYTFAVLQALSTYEQSKWLQEGFHPVTEAWGKLKLAAEALATRPGLRHVLLLGPAGSGKSYLAQYLFERCGLTMKAEHNLDAAELEKQKDLLAEHRSGAPPALYIGRAELIITTMQGEVQRWMKADEDDPGGRRRLCVWSAESWERVQSSAVLSDSLKSHFHGMEQLQVPPVTAANVAAHAEDLRQRLWPSYSFGDGVVAKLQGTDWPFHVRSLRQALHRAVKAATQAGRTTLLPADFARHPPSGQLTPDYVAEMPQAAPTIDRKALARELRRLRGGAVDNRYTATYLRGQSEYPLLQDFAAQDEDLFLKAMKRLKDPNNKRYTDIAEFLMTGGSKGTHDYRKRGSASLRLPDSAFATNAQQPPRASKKRSA